MVMIPSLLPIFKEKPACKLADADGYTLYASYLAGQPSYFKEQYFFGHEELYNPYTTAFSINFGQNEGSIISSYQNGSIRIFNRTHSTKLKKIQTNHGSISSILSHPKNDLIISGGWDGTLQFWNKDGQALRAPIFAHKAGVTSISISPDGKIIASAGWDGNIRLWSTKGYLIGNPLKGHKASITSVHINPNKKIIASSSTDGTIKFWNFRGLLLKSISNHEAGHYSIIRFSPNGELIACGSNAGTINLWNTDGKLIQTIHSDAITALAFHPKGSTFATNHSGFIRIWNLDGSIHKDITDSMNREVTSLSFSQTGSHLLSIDRNGNIHSNDLYHNNTIPVSSSNFDLAASNQHEFLPGLPYYFRQVGYPFLLSKFMQITGKYHACAARIMQPAILIILVLSIMIWVRIKFGILYSLAMLIPFLDPSNDLVIISRMDLADFPLALSSFFSILLIYKTLLSKEHRKKYFLACLLFIFISAGMKPSACMVFILTILSISIISCIGKVIPFHSSLKYNLKPILIKSFLLLLLIYSIIQFHFFISPGTKIFNSSTIFTQAYLISAPQSQNPLLQKIKHMQEIVENGGLFQKQKYIGANLITTPGWDPSLYRYLPIWQYPPAIIDPSDNSLLQLNRQEFEQGAYLLLRSNPFDLLSIIAKRIFRDDHKNLFTFSQMGNKVYFYGLICSFFLIIGIIKLYQSYPLICLSTLSAYTLFFLFLSFVHVPLGRYLLPFAGFYYIAFTSGVVATISYLYSLLAKK